MDFGNVIGESPVNVVSVTVPETPVRPSPQRPESGCNLNTKLHVGFDLNSIQSGMDIGVSSDACASTSDKGATQDFCAGVDISKEAPKMVNAPSTPASKQSLKKRGNNGIDLNKNPSKRPKMKRHRPKILDIFKTKKVPKPKTEKPVKRKYVKKAKPKQEFVQEGQGNKVKPYEILNPVTPERSIPNHAMIIETPPALEETVEAGQELKATTTPCKRALIFNMEEDLIEEKAPFKWDLNLQDQDFDSCPHLHKIVKDHRDGEKKSLTKSQIKRGGVGRVGEVKSNPGQSKALIVYRRAFKPNLCKSVIVYQRTFKPDQCEKNCRKLGPNFPKICKQKRAIRKRREDCMMILEKLLGDDDNNSLMKRILRPRNQIRTAKASKRVNPLHPKAKATRKRLMSYTSKGNDSNALTPSFFNLVIRKKRSKLILRKRVFPNPLPMMVPQACSKDKALIEFMNQEPEGLGTTTMTTTTNSTQLVVQDQTNHGAILPYEPKKKKYQAKVIIDAITLSKWNALMENIPELFDEEKDKFWNSERLAFSLLVKHFIRQMYHVQGNRKFQFWGGTVTESVIGAFLTQNVSDHLSSSAYMKLRATFPEKEKKTEKPKCPCVGGDKERCPMCREKIQDVLDLFAYKDSDEEISASTPARNDLVSAPEAAPESVTTPAQNDLVSAPESVPTPARNDLVSAPEAAPTPARNDLTSVPEAALESVPELEQTASFREVIDTEMKLYLEKYVTESSSGPSSLEKEALSLEKGPSSLEKAPLSLEKAPSTPEPKTKKKREPKPPPPVIDWDELRRTYAFPLREPVKGSIDMEAIRAASNEQVANTIAMRGQHRIIGGRIKDLLDRLVKDHGSTDLEWLRDVPPEKAKDFLLSIKGLGLKSVECIRLLTLHHIAFPVDVNVGRVAVRLGWVPLEPLPDGVQIHLLNSYPMMDSIQKYLWPRLCTLDQETLYELHYQLITFGKIFCTKIQPNCNACPMKTDCRHFRSAFNSSMFRLRGPGEQESVYPDLLSLPYSPDCEPMVEFPQSPEPYKPDIMPLTDIEDFPYNSDDEMPLLKLNNIVYNEDYTNQNQNQNQCQNQCQNSCQNQCQVQNEGEGEGEGNISQALVAVSLDSRLPPLRKLKNVNRLRTEHLVYEIPDKHPLLANLEARVDGDPSPYLLAISGEFTAEPEQGRREEGCNNSSEETETTCSGSGSGSSSSSGQVYCQGTIFIPCRTAQRGCFPLNGTYFQVNEVFADHESSEKLITVPRDSIWALPRRTLFCGSSTSAIMKGLPIDEIQRCNWGGFICVRGFDRQTRFPKPLSERFHMSTTSVGAAAAAKKKQAETE